MTDRGRPALRQSQRQFKVGPSGLRWTGRQLFIDVDEWAAPPHIGRVRGRITVTPSALTQAELPLTPNGTHVWRPFGPIGRIDVDLNRGLSWSGHGYFDGNFGTRALEQDFSYWTWARFPTRNGAVAFYDAERLDGSHLSTAVRFDRDGTVSEIPPPDRLRFNRSLWAVRRETRGDAGYRPRQVKAMLDAPFYSRSVIRTQIDGEECEGVHEALDLVRYRQAWLKPMIALRVPRRRNWPAASQSG